MTTTPPDQQSAEGGLKMAAKHTPGPWSIYDRREVCDEIWIGVVNPDGFEVTHAAVRYGCEEAEELGDIEANARLIASAPDLLAALKEAVEDLVSFYRSRGCEYEGTEDDLVGRYRAAIRQAEGGE